MEREKRQEKRGNKEGGRERKREFKEEKRGDGGEIRKQVNKRDDRERQIEIIQLKESE